MMHFKFIYLTFNFFLISFYTFSNEKIEVSIYNKNITFNVEVAKTIEERRTGLMYRKKLLNNEGMLFIFPREKIIQLWMKNTYIPLDLGFFREDMTLIEVKELSPRSLNSVCSSEPAKYALELSKGWFSSHNVKDNSKLILN